ncbi:UNVERIFIED_CONTAM: hypothetical protein GTU68_019804 [Idotea baltica]|nr:hypothetical protein [Idotea baltica]
MVFAIYVTILFTALLKVMKTISFDLLHYKVKLGKN